VLADLFETRHRLDGRQVLEQAKPLDVVPSFRDLDALDLAALLSIEQVAVEAILLVRRKEMLLVQVRASPEEPLSEQVAGDQR
jgi:hypothetical protein